MLLYKNSELEFERMNSNKDSEEEEVFADDVASPENNQLPVVGLRRSARKRKSISGEAEVDSNAKARTAGKRHRPLGTMAGVQRSPKKQVRPDTRHLGNTPAGRTQPGPTLTVATDPPTPTPTPEQLVLLGGMRAVLQDELSKTEQRLTGRMDKVEEGFDDLRQEFKGLEKRIEAVEKKAEVGNRSYQRTIQDSLNMMEATTSGPSATRDARYWKARRSLRIWPVQGEGDQPPEVPHPEVKARGRCHSRHR